MAKYSYQAEDSDRRAVAGEIEAASIDDARQQLVANGLRILTLVDAGSVAAGQGDAPPLPSQESPRALSAQDAEEVTIHLAQVSGADLPIAPGLRAAALEVHNRRVADALMWIAKQLEIGMPLHQVVTNSKPMFPRYVGSLISVASRSGRLGPVLSDLVEQQREARDLRRSILASLTYPIVVMCLGTLVMLFTMLIVTRPFQMMFEEFELDLPFLTRLLFWCRDVGLAATIVMATLLIAALKLGRVVFGAARWYQVISRFPLIGPCFEWSGIAEWANLLSTLLRQNLPLPEALRLSGDGLQNAHIGQLSIELAEGVERGGSMSTLLAKSQHFPTTLATLVRWGESQGALAEAIETGGKLFGKRVRLRATLLRSILPSLLFILIGSGVVFVLASLFLPLVSLIQGLS